MKKRALTRDWLYFSRTMPRPVTISDDDILQATRALFVAKGPLVTTAEIARKAGVSEGILFKRFGTKAALLRASLTSDMVKTFIEDNVRLVGPLRAQRDFERLIRRQLEVLRSVVPITVMAWSSRSIIAGHPAEPRDDRPPPLVALRAIAAMLEHEMDAGHLARRNPEAVARIMTGATWYFVFLELSVERANRRFGDDTFVEELARLIFADVAPRTRAARTGPRPTAQRRRGRTAAR
jgi:AcrR family transcriptional regulator